MSLIGVLLLAFPLAVQAAPPSCLDASFTILPNQRLDFPAPACTDPDAGDTYAVSSFTTPAHGVFGGTLSAPNYTPNAGFHGRDEFTYKVTDNHGEESAAAKVSILIDTAPTCDSSAGTVPMNGRLDVADFPCDDADDSSEFGVFVDDGAHGTVDVNQATGIVTYTPNAGFVGTDSFPYYAEDDFGLRSVLRAMTITVTSPAAAPAPTPVPAPTPPRLFDRTAPAVALKSATKPLKQTLANGLSIVLSSDEAGTATLTLTLDKASARKLGVDRKAKGPVTVGTLKTPVTKGASTVVVKFSAKARKALKSARRVKLLLTAVVADAAGNKATKTLTVTRKQ
jgi:hypothetical protein